MTIYYYFRELKTPMYWWQRIHIFDELKRYGHQIITFNPLDYSSYEEANEQVLVDLSKCKNIDVFLTCVDSNIIYPSTIEEIKRKGIPTILVCWDNLELPYKHKIIAPLFDLVWITSQETKYLFEEWGCKNIIFQTYAANPFVFKPDWNQCVNAVGFIGSPYGSRINKINDLLEAKVDCNIYSNSLFYKGYNTSKDGKHDIDFKDLIIKAIRYCRFPIGRKVLYSTIKNKLNANAILNSESVYLHKYKSVSDEDMISLYSNLALSLNITELRDTYILRTPIHKIHLRAFEIPMCGGLQFASYNEELASYFVEDKEIVFYRSKEEMIEKACFYINENRENMVKKMKMQARKKAEAEHTWNIRFNRVIQAL